MEAQPESTGLAERFNAVVITTCAGKGVVPESYPLNLGGSLVRPGVQQFLPSADVMLAVGTELVETIGPHEHGSFPTQREPCHSGQHHGRRMDDANRAAHH